MYASAPQEALQIGMAGHQWCHVRHGAVFRCEHPRNVSRMDLSSCTWKGLGHWNKGRCRGWKSLGFFFDLFSAFYFKKPEKTLKNPKPNPQGKVT